MEDRLKSIEDEALRALEDAQDKEAVEAVKVRYLGRKGLLTGVLKGLGQLPKEERPKIGRLANEVKTRIEKALKERLEALSSAGGPKLIKGFDPTLPGRRLPVGHLHPITKVLNEVCGIFERLGFSTAQGPEIELDFYNFEALNIPPDHPARDMQDTFYVDDKVLLRTHTSPIQVRTMEIMEPPIRIIAPGKVYRCDSDITHTPMFHQVEGLMVDEDVSFAHLKGILTHFAQEIFHKDTKVRFRPSFFPFTEPSAEIDIQCVICRGEGCRVCSQTGWLEVLGAGLVHPAVFRHVGIDPERYSGFAFGLGIERIAMLKYGINDIRLFYDNDMRFLNQF
ncbi:MAG: phenylalanine--tRNA ligase subunit alpha [Thermodesulfobacteria bacterium]|nr:phenylalanine--tRNA ligase subunit alpha [Thermodesulfobacteriota bacterium]